MDEYGKLARTTPLVPLGGGEGAYNVLQAVQMMRLGADRFIEMDTGRIGGITAAKQVADQAATLGMTYLNRTLTSGRALASSLVSFAGIEDHVVCEYRVEAKSLAREIAGSSFPLDADGLIGLDDQPGLGVQVDVPALHECVVQTEIRMHEK